MEKNIFICGIDIGNDKDFPIRSKECLENSDCIIVEHIAEFNQRIAPKLNLKKNIELIEFNFSVSKSESTINKIISLSKNNKKVSLISNSGMPSIYDPGIDIINGLLDNGIGFEVIPGPVSLINALVISGYKTDYFIFAGDCGIGKERINKFIKIKEKITENSTVIFFEIIPDAMPHTIQDMIDIFGEKSRIAICINMTMSNETIFNGNLKEAATWAKKYSDNRDSTNHNINISYVCDIVV